MSDDGIEDGWEHSPSPPMPCRDAARTILRRAFPNHTVGAMRRLAGGNRNTNVAVDLGSWRVVLRLFRPGDPACIKEHRLLDALVDDVPVPRVLYADTTPLEGFPFLLLEWVDGARLADAVQANPAATGRDVGEVLGRIHRRRFSVAGRLESGIDVVTPFGDSDSWAAFLTRTLDQGRAAQRLGVRLASALRRFVERNARAVEDATSAACVVHADFKPPNVLIDSSGRVAAVLDWEFAFAGPALFDIGIMLRYEGALPNAYLESFRLGYEAESGRLPEDWRRMARSLDLVNLCDLANRPHDAPRMFKDVRRLVATSLRALAA